MSARTIALLAGLGLGLAIVLVLPAGWLFTPDVAVHADHGDGAQFACPMFCVVMDQQPADGRCPVCGMELDEVSGEQKLTRPEQAMAGIEAVRLARVPLVATVRVVGEVDYDERLVSRITTRMSGWLTEVPIEAGWVEVAEGDPVVSIYSPELLAAQEELLVARESGDATLLSAARRRLVLLGVADAEIAAIGESGRASDSITLRSPLDGVVVERNAVPGAAVKKGATLVTVADLSRVWIQTQVYERDLPRVRIGQRVLLAAATLPEPIVGLIRFVDPVIDRRTRTARVRIEIDNPKTDDGSRLLRIGQRVDATIEARLTSAGDIAAPDAELVTAPLALPASAVLRTGIRTIVYALFTEMIPGKPDYQLDPGNLPETVLYRLVEVRIGPAARRADGDGGDSWLPVLDAGGLPAGALVVARGNLLLDSQAQLSGRPSLLFPQGNRAGGEPHSGH